jgi:hypothetical protein
MTSSWAFQNSNEVLHSTTVLYVNETEQRARGKRLGKGKRGENPARSYRKVCERSWTTHLRNVAHIGARSMYFGVGSHVTWQIQSVCFAIHGVLPTTLCKPNIEIHTLNVCVHRCSNDYNSWTKSCTGKAQGCEIFQLAASHCVRDC